MAVPKIWMQPGVPAGTGAGTQLSPYNINDVLTPANPKAAANGTEFVMMYNGVTPYVATTNLGTPVGSCKIYPVDYSGNPIADHWEIDFSGVVSGIAFYVNDANTTTHFPYITNAPADGIDIGSSGDNSYIYAPKVIDAGAIGIDINNGASHVCVAYPWVEGSAQEDISCAGMSTGFAAVYKPYTKRTGSGSYSSIHGPCYLFEPIVELDGSAQNSFPGGGIYMPNGATSFVDKPTVVLTNATAAITSAKLIYDGANFVTQTHYYSDALLLVEGSGHAGVEGFSFINNNFSNMYRGANVHNCNTDVTNPGDSLWRNTPSNTDPELNDTSIGDYSPTVDISAGALLKKRIAEARWMGAGALSDLINSGGGGGGGLLVHPGMSGGMRG